MPKTGQNRLKKLFFGFLSLSLLCITVVISGMIFSVLIHSGYAAWIDPDSNWKPPNSSIQPPINTSGVDQGKLGGLGVGINNGGLRVGPTVLALGEKVHVSTATQENALVILDNGNVGIHKNTPEYPLAVEGNIGAVGGGHFITRESGGKFEMYQGSNSAYDGEVPGVFDVSLGGSLGEPGGFVFKTYESGPSQEKVRIDPDGQVGVGVSDPTARLEILESGSDSAIKAINNNRLTAAIYAKNNNTKGVAIAADAGGGVGLLVRGSNDYGVKSFSTKVGVYGEGSDYGIRGFSPAGTAVYGDGSPYGVQGVSGANFGILGTNAGEGLHAEGANYGVKAIGSTGLYAEGTGGADTYGIHAKKTSDYAAYIEGTTYMTNTLRIGTLAPINKPGILVETNGQFKAASFKSTITNGSNIPAVYTKATNKAFGGIYVEGELGKFYNNNYYGVYGQASAAGATGPVGALGYRDHSGSLFYGVYGSAGTGAGTRYAGYFEGGKVKISQGGGDGLVSEFLEGSSPPRYSFAVVADASEIEADSEESVLGLKACGPESDYSLCTYLGGSNYAGYFQGPLGIMTVDSPLIPHDPLHSSMSFFGDNYNSLVPQQSTIKYNSARNALVITIMNGPASTYPPTIYEFCGPNEDTVCSSGTCGSTLETCVEDKDCYYLGCITKCSDTGGVCKATPVVCDNLGKVWDPALDCSEDPGGDYCCVNASTPPQKK